jgi:tetratricopeptide (TPR) repeat protein
VYARHLVDPQGHARRPHNREGPMKKIFVTTIVLIGLLACPAFAQSGRLANQGKAGLYVRSLDQVLRLHDSEMDLATAALIASEKWSDMVYGRRYLERLDDMALEIRERLRQQRLHVNHHAIPIINDYLFNELGFKTISDADDPDDLFLHSVMDRRQGYCLSLSVLYLAIGERLGLKVYGVVVPGHFFVRYESGRTRFNIETTANGASPPDEHYIQKFGVPDNNRGTIYLQNLTKRQALGCFFNNLGNVYNDIGDADTAQVALERAVAINPTLSESRANLGNIYLDKGRVEDAIRQYLAALELNPSDPKTHNNLGNAYTELDRLSFAVSSYRRSIALDPNFVDAYRNLALAFARHERYGEALSELRQAVSVAPEDAAIHSQLGELYYNMSNHHKAIQQFREALQLKRDSAEAHYGLARCYRKLGQTASEIRAYQNTLAINPDMLPAVVNLGNAYFGQGNYDSAIHYYRRAIELKGDDAWIYYNLGSAYSNKSDYAQAVQTYQQALEIDPDIADAHHGLAYGLYMLDQFDLAWEHIKRAKELGAKVSDDQMRAIESRVK